MSFHLLVLAMSMLLITACQPIVAQSDGALPKTTEEDEFASAIEAIYAEMAASIIDGDIDRWIALFADDGVQMQPGMPADVGKEQIRTSNSGFLDMIDVGEMAVTSHEVKRLGPDFAFASGVYTMTLTPAGGEPIPFEGKFLTIFQQQPDGSWKIYRDITNSNLAPGQE